MRATPYTDDTLRALMDLALAPEETPTVAEIAPGLAEAGEIEILRGRQGGIRLAKRPVPTHLAIVVRQAEPDRDRAPCFAGRRRLRARTIPPAARSAASNGKDCPGGLGRSALADLISPGGPTAEIFRSRTRKRSSGFPPPRAVFRRYIRPAAPGSGASRAVPVRPG